MNDRKYPVSEIFQSIQGEGPFTGEPSQFIRLAGCNLSCSWCDTPNNNKAEFMSAEEIVSQLLPRYSAIVITGGEPTIHPLGELIAAIRRHFPPAVSYGFGACKISIETNGLNPTNNFLYEGVPLEADYIICSPKPPKFFINPQCNYYALKYVVDGEFTLDVIPKRAFERCAGRIFLQPEASQLTKRLREAYNFAMNDPRLRVGIQLHKIMEVR